MKTIESLNEIINQRANEGRIACMLTIRDFQNEREEDVLFTISSNKYVDNKSIRSYFDEQHTYTGDLMFVKFALKSKEDVDSKPKNKKVKVDA